MEKIFLIAFRASQAARGDFYASQTGGFSACSYVRHSFFVQANVLDDTAGADVFAREFELGFDENQEIRARFGAGGSRSKYFANGDEGYVGDDQGDLLGNVFRGKLAGVAFDGDNARVLLELPGELGDVYIDGVDSSRAELKQAIREAAGGRANVETNEPRWI